MAQLFWLSGQTLVDGNGAPYAAAKASFFETGTTTPKATYSNAGLTSANTNPVVADANGRFPDIYLIAGRYKVTLTTSADVAIDTLDPVDGTSQLITAASAPATTYPFLRYYNTTTGLVSRRSADNTTWIEEGPVDSLISGATVSEVLTGTSTAKAVTPDSLAGVWQRGADIASASTLSLPAGGGGVFNVTGTTGITGISSAQGGRSVRLRFAGSLVLTHNASSFILPGAQNITVSAGDVAHFINDAAQDASGSNWRCYEFQYAAGGPALAPNASSKTGNYTATDADRGGSIRFAGLSADATLTLPAASGRAGFLLYVSNTDTSNWAVTIDPNGAELLDGFSTRKTWPRSSITILCDGTGWRTVSGEYRAVSTAAVPSLGGTVSVNHGFGVKPDNVWAIITCTSANLSYSVGDTVILNPTGTANGGATQNGVGVYADATLIAAVVSTSAIAVPTKGTGSFNNITLASWTLQVVAVTV